MNCASRHCPRSSTATTCWRRSSTTRRSAPRRACSTRPTRALSGLGPFRTGLDVCCGTGAGHGGPPVHCARTGSPASTSAPGCSGRRAVPIRMPRSCGPMRGRCRSTRASTWRSPSGRSGISCRRSGPRCSTGVYRALRPGGLLAFPVGSRPPVTSIAHWATLGFDLAMRVRNAVWRPPFVMYYRTNTMQEVSRDLTAAGFTVRTVPLSPPGYNLVIARK